MKTQTLKIFLLAVISSCFISAKASTLESETKTAVTPVVEISEDEVVKDLEIEDWMVNDAVWGINTNTEMEIKASDSEEDLAIEKWMTDDNLWKMKTNSDQQI